MLEVIGVRNRSAEQMCRQEPPRAPVLSVEISALDTATGQLLESVDILRRRVGPVCKVRSETNAVQSPAPSPETTGVPFGDQLREQRSRVETARRAIEAITESVEL